MGVPAFYRWLSQKYPKTIVDVKEEYAQTVDGQRIPVDTSKPNPNDEEFDNLYLDMNGIIHPASHPEDRPPPATEDDMYLAIFEYLDRIVASVRPRKLLYMAIDGVAPRAKMNQQRSRRFRSAQERIEREQMREELLAEWQAEGRELPPPKGPEFDSNVITPGTPFMDRLAVYLRAFIHNKIDTDPGWRNIKVILSDASVPGEGEHKIMEHIRLQRNDADYNPNTRHVIHGLDADLIMLALATHEPYFYILREEVTFNKNKPSVEPTVDEEAPPEAPPLKPLQFLRINVLREYLEKEMVEADYSCVGGFDLERVIDDFVFMCFFVGNDFLPHLPSLEIREGAIDTIMDLYRRSFPVLGGYLTDGGKVDLARVATMMDGLAMVENLVLRKRKEKEERFKQKQVDLANKTRTREHLELIRKCTNNINDFLVPVASSGGEPVAKRPRRQDFKNDAGIHAGTNLDEVTAEAFRIKNRTVGGRRSLQPGVDERDATKLHLFDRIREFADDVAPTHKKKLELRSLDSSSRRIAHDYCEELGLGHESQGTEPNRFIVVTRPWDDNSLEGDDEDEDEDIDGSLAADARANELKEALKARVRAKNDELMSGNVDKVQLGTEGWKERYYEVKFGPQVDRRHVCEKYIEGLVWVMKYYYEGCQSWTWFYPYHYAPFPSDLRMVTDFEPNFDLGRPFKPFEQLMAVFPPGSAHALPAAYSKLMTDPKSPIAEFYPEQFEIDMDGKRWAWQAVVLLPFIDEKRLLEQVSALEHTLTADEKRRNKEGCNHLFVHMTSPAAKQLVDLEPATADAASGDQAADDKVPTEAEINAMAAEQLRAELMGDEERSNELKAQMEKARQKQKQQRFKQHEKAIRKLPPGCVPLDTKLVQMAGFVRICDDAPQPGEDFVVPGFRGRESEHYYMLQTFRNNVICAEFYEPEYKPHIPRVLSSCKMPEPVLDSLDVPMFVRYIQIRNLPNRRMDIKAAQRMLRPHMGPMGASAAPPGPAGGHPYHPQHRGPPPASAGHPSAHYVRHQGFAHRDATWEDRHNPMYAHARKRTFNESHAASVLDQFPARPGQPPAPAHHAPPSGYAPRYPPPHPPHVAGRDARYMPRPPPSGPPPPRHDPRRPPPAHLAERYQYTPRGDAPPPHAARPHAGPPPPHHQPPPYHGRRGYDDRGGHGDYSRRY